MFTIYLPATYPTFTFIYIFLTTHPPLFVNVNCERPLKEYRNFVLAKYAAKIAEFKQLKKIPIFIRHNKLVADFDQQILWCS